MKKRVAQYMVEQPTARSATASGCGASRCRSRSPASTSPRCRALPLEAARRAACARTPTATAPGQAQLESEHPEKAVVTQRIARGPLRAPRGAARPRARLPLARAQHADALARRAAAAAARDAGALESVRRGVRARRAVGRPASGRHRGAARARSTGCKASGNSLFVVEHELDVIRHADWIVDVGPAAGEHGGRDPLQRSAGRARADVKESQTRRVPVRRDRRTGRAHAARAAGWLRAARRDAQQPARPRRRSFRSACSRRVTGVSGSGKSSLVSQALVELVGAAPRARRSPRTRKTTTR